MAELYGVLDTDTRDWTDGLLSNIFREINKPLPPGKVGCIGCDVRPMHLTSCYDLVFMHMLQSSWQWVLQHSIAFYLLSARYAAAACLCLMSTMHLMIVHTW